MNINRCIAAAATAALVTLGAGVAAAQQPTAPKGAYAKGASSHKHPRTVKALPLYARPACTLLTCLTPVNTGP